MNILRHLSGLRTFALPALLSLSTSIFSGTSSAQVPGSPASLFPSSTGPGPYILPIPSVLDDAPNSLFALPKGTEGASGIRPSTISEERARQFKTSLSLSSGYDTAIDDVPHAAGEVIFAEGFLGMIQHQRSFDMVLQHDSQFSDSYGTGVGLEQYQHTTATIIPTEYRRTMLSVLLENGYGTDSVRASGNIAPSSLTNSPLPDSNVTDFGLVSGNILTDHGIFGLQHRISRSRTAEIQGGGYFYHFFETGTSDQQYNLSGMIKQRWSERQTLGVKAEVVQEHYSSLDCTTGSLTFSSLTEFSESTRLEGSIGPALGSASCARTFEYHVALTSTTPRGRSYYVGSAREPSNGFIENAAWEESTFAGFSFGQPRSLLSRTDAGYSRYVVADPTTSNPNQQGYFVSGELHHRFSDLAGISLMARFFYRNDSPTNLNRGLFFLTYTWSREERPTHVQTLGGQNANQ